VTTEMRVYERKRLYYPELFIYSGKKFGWKPYN